MVFGGFNSTCLRMCTSGDTWPLTGGFGCKELSTISLPVGIVPVVLFVDSAVVTVATVIVVSRPADRASPG